MLAALIWLTISLPFAYAAQLELTKEKLAAAGSTPSGKEDDSCNPFANTTEEKTSSPNTLSEEYLHNQEEQIHFLDNKLSHPCHHSYDLYVAFHGELISPPPKI